MDLLRVTLIQANLIWENALQNRLNFESKINYITEKTDLIVLPEMFTTGFSMTPNTLAETMDGPTIIWMSKLASKHQTAICGSLIIKENNNYYNKFLLVTPEGEIHQYNKRHLFTLAGEQHQYTAGEELTIIEYKGWKICPQVCYDLRFPAWARNSHDYDLLLYVANWPKQRIMAWNTLLQARSIENMCYTIGVNRVGIDPNGNEYSGSSKVFDYLGEEISNIVLNQEDIETIILHKPKQQTVRKKLGFLNDQDSFTLT